jgi:hypothetical protein
VRHSRSIDGPVGGPVAGVRDMIGYRHFAAALALAGTAVALPAQAQAHCWADREVAAAQVRDMQTMLMVAALRCRAAHIDISADYDGFVTTQKVAIDQANLAIKQHFAQAGGAQSDYDHFATSLANVFGDDETSEATCAEASALAHEASSTAPTGLGALAMARVFPAALPGGSCAAPVGGTLAAVSAAPTKLEAQPVLIALAAPTPAAAAPVTLPADVVTAMTVMARYQATQGAAASAPVLTAAVVADEAPVMGPVQLWQVGEPTQIAGLQR